MHFQDTVRRDATSGSKPMPSSPRERADVPREHQGKQMVNDLSIIAGQAYASPADNPTHIYTRKRARSQGGLRRLTAKHLYSLVGKQNIQLQFQAPA